MPNWCSTNIYINHEDNVALGRFMGLLETWTSKDYMPNGFGHSWLGNVVGNSGIGTIDAGNETDLRCRGSISYIDLTDGQLQIATETAWAPMLEMWVKLVDKYLPGAEIFYNAEEPGCEIYATNDPDYVGKYVIDSMRNDIESDYEASEDLVREVLQELLNTKETNVQTLINLLCQSDVEDIWVHEWDYEEIDVWY